MSLSSTTSRNDYTGNGSVSSYSYNFRIFLATDLLVTVADTSSPPVQTTLALNTDFTVTGAGSVNGGNVVLVSSGQSWLSGGNLKTGYHLTIRRVRPVTQTTDIRNQGTFFPETHEDTFDHCVMLAQQLLDLANRSAKNPETLLIASFDPTLPTDINKASIALVTNPSGTGFAAGPTTSAIANANADAIAAAASQAAAATSETNAATSATGAAASAAAAATSASSASTSATAASGSATSASTSATSASGSAAAASTSATNAATSATSASGSAAAASTSATNAASSATSASTSATNAAASATAAAASATSAAAAASSAIGAAVRFLTISDSPVTLAQSDQGKILTCDTSGGAIVINLPAIAGLTLSSSFMVAIKKSSTDSNTITINRGSTDTFDNGDTAKTIRAAGNGFFLVPSTVPNPDKWASMEFSAAGGGGGGGALHWVEDSNAPFSLVENHNLVYAFQSALAQTLYALIKVPASYAGAQILLKCDFYSADNSGNALVQSQSTLVRQGTDAITSTTNQRTSTNAAATLGAGTVNIPQSVSLDLTDTTGKINGVSVSAGDYIIVKLTRGTDTATSDVKVPVYGTEVSFT